MNIRQLKYFLDLAKTLNFTRTAENFFISQTAVTQQIRKLEEIVNVQLFKRTKQYVELTPAGRSFFFDVQEIMQRLDKAVDKAKATSLGVKGNLSVGFFIGFSQTKYLHFLKKFREEFSEVDLNLECQTVTNLYQGLINRKYDLVFNIKFDVENNNLIKYKELAQYRLCAVMPSEHPLANAVSIPRSRLKNEQFILNEFKGAPHDGTQFMMEDYFRAGFVPKVIMQTNDTQIILMMVYIGMGITIVPEFWAHLAKQILNLAFVPLEGDNEKISLVVAWNKQNSNPALVNVIRSLTK